MCEYCPARRKSHRNEPGVLRQNLATVAALRRFSVDGVSLSSVVTREHVIHFSSEFHFSSEAPWIWRLLPDYYIDDIWDFLMSAAMYEFEFDFSSVRSFLSRTRMVPQTLSKRNIDDILTLMLCVICAPRHYVQNPHIIAKAVEVVHWLCARSEHTMLRQATEYLFNHRLAQDALVRALTKLYAGNENSRRYRHIDIALSN